MIHLPECPCNGTVCFDGSLHEPFEAEVSGRCRQCGGVCICGALRACEQRVIDEGDYQSQIAYESGYATALDQAEAAILKVAEIWTKDLYGEATYALIDLSIPAIHALRKE